MSISYIPFVFPGVPQVRCAFQTRAGGVSLGEFGGGNIAFTVQDNPEHVIANRRSLLEGLRPQGMGLRDGNLFFDGPVANVFTEENLGALYNIPICVLPHPRWGLPQALLASAKGPWSGKKTASPAAPADAAEPDAPSGYVPGRSAGGQL